MQYSTFARLARENTGTDSTTWTDQDLVDRINLCVETLTGMIIRSDEQCFQSLTTRSLIADQRQYELPFDVANQIIRVEAKVDGTNWQIAKEVDINTIKGSIASETDIKNTFNDGYVYFTLFRNCINIYTNRSITDVTNGLQLWYNVYPHIWQTSDLTTNVDISVDVTSTDVGFPREFHECLLYMTTKTYKESKERPLPLSEMERSIDTMIQRSLEAYRGMNRSRSVNGILPYDIGTSY